MKKREADYKQIYLTLFDEVTMAIEKLQNIQKACEEIYIDSTEENKQ